MKISRREFLKLGLMGGTALVMPFGASACSSLSDDLTGNVLSSKVRLPGPFRVPLPIPPVLEPTASGAHADYYEVTQKVGRAEILPGLRTEVWGYEGIFPGPTIETRIGRRIVVRQRNELPVPVSVHLHGGVTPPESDGYPTDLILPRGHDHDAHATHGAPGEHAHMFKDYSYPNAHRAATLWYHDHRMDFTGPQVYRGLAGMYLLRDEVEDALPLPGGEREVPLVISDRTFRADGSFYYPSLDPTLQEEPGVLAHAANGMFGDTVLVNGAPWPFLEVSNTMHRLRILNASNARSYDLALDPPPPGGRPFVQIGSDGGLLKAPVPHDSIVIAPAERFDVVVDFSRYPVGTEVTLKNRRGEGRTTDVMRFVVARGEKEESSVPERLAPALDFPGAGEAEVTRRFEFQGGPPGGMSTINGETFDPERLDARPRLGSTEIWEVFADPSHPFHMHLVHFKVLSRDGGPPGPHDAGWKDTVSLEGGSVRVAVRFEGWRGKYVFHCHNLEHEDMMMMANFEVV